MNLIVTKKIKSAPKKPGVYLFYKDRQPLYIGKAADLKSRLKSYLKPMDIKTDVLSKEANRLRLIECQSPIAALIEEARQIKRLQPKLNVYWRDDKQYFYIAFTKEKFPKVFITHRPQLEIRNLKFEINSIGPFTDGRALKLVLRIIRRRYEYCTCRESHFRQCINSQIGLCPGFCCVKKQNLTKFNFVRYQKNIKNIKSILSGDDKKLLEKITMPSDRWAAENIFSHSQILDGNAPQKIECYDVSNLSGKEAVGAMTRFRFSKDSGGQAVLVPEKSLWRKFKIKTAATRDDPKMIAEIVGRRLRHPEWPYPDLIIVDGGKTQYNAAKKAVGNLDVIGFAKPNKQVIGAANLRQPANLPDKNTIEKAIRQTHSFAIRYHRQLRKNQLK